LYKCLTFIFILSCLLSCSKKTGNSHLVVYVGTYPDFIQPNDPVKVPFLQLPEIAKLMKNSLPLGVMEEMKSLTTQMPIEEIGHNYLYVHMCEQHNCSHAIHILLNTETLEPIALLFNSDSSGNYKANCFSNSWSIVEKISVINNPEFLKEKLQMSSETIQWFLPTVCEKANFKYIPQPPVNHNNA